MSSSPVADVPVPEPVRSLAPRRRLMLAILWPAFVMAGVLEALVFALIDPRALHVLDSSLRLSPTAIHSIGFLTFWAVIASSAAITQLLEADAPDALPDDR